MADHRLANIFGALTIAVADGIASRAERAVERGGATSAALVLIGHVPGVSIDAISRPLGLSHAGAVRLVDRLAEDGFVERHPSTEDRRVVGLRLTLAGKRKRKAILAERQSAIEGLLAKLTRSERELLAEISNKLLIAHVDTPETAMRVCRFCDESVCERCPVGHAIDAG